MADLDFQLMWYIIGCEEELNLLSVANSTSPSVSIQSSRGFSHFFSDPFPTILEPGIGCSRSKISLFYYSSTKKSLFDRSEKSAVSITHHNDEGKKRVHVPLPKGHSLAICLH